MSSRFGVIVQAIGVAALGAVVYFAFLQPGDPNPLSGIEVEGDLPAEAVPGETAKRNRGRSTPGGEDGRTSPARAVGIRLIPTSPSGIPPTPAIDTETPTGEQYQDAAARVLGQVVRAQPSVQARQDPAP